MFRGSYSGLGFLSTVIILCVAIAYFQNELRRDQGEQIGQAFSSSIIEDESVAHAALPREDHSKIIQPAVPEVKAPSLKVKKQKTEKPTALKEKEVKATESAVQKSVSIKPVLPVPRDLVDEGQLKSRWIDSLSGRHAQMNFSIRSKEERCSVEAPCEIQNSNEIRIAGVVVDTDNLEIDGDLENGSYDEGTPAVYLK